MRAFEAGLAGSVVLEGVITTDGKLRDLWFRESIPQFDKAAFEAVSQWEYKPTLLEGKAVEVIMTTTVNFNIPGSPPNLPPPILFTITRENEQLKVSRPASEGSETISYRLDGQSSKNKLETGGASDRTYLYTSAWNGQKLVSQIAFKTRFGARTNSETIWLDAGRLVIETIRNEADGAPMVTQRHVFQRR